MSSHESSLRPAAGLPVDELFIQEFQHLRTRWLCLFLVGVLLVVGGTASLVTPIVTLSTSVAAMIVLGVSLIVGGICTISASFWAGKTTALLLNLFIGILYIVAGFVITDAPLRAAAMMAAFIAALFIVGGLFRIVAAVLLRFPHWGWTLLNGLVTLICGVAIYRHFSRSALWVVGLLVGIEMLLHGWNWIVLALAVRRIPAPAP